MRHDMTLKSEAIETMSSLELLDVINESRKEHGQGAIRRNDFHDRVADELEGEFYESFVKPSGANGGRPSKAFLLNRDQCLLVSMRESKAVRRSVLKKLKRPSISSQKELIEGAGAFMDVLRIEGSSRITCMKAFAASNCPQYLPLLPDYAIDAPSVSGDGSSLPTASASELLKQHRAGITAAYFNKVCHAQGLLEKMTRTNSKGKEVAYWCVTQIGLEYGKNVTSPQSPRQTQPHWFCDRFSELLKVIGFEKAA